MSKTDGTRWEARSQMLRRRAVLQLVLHIGIKGDGRQVQAMQGGGWGRWHSGRAPGWEERPGGENTPSSVLVGAGWLTVNLHSEYRRSAGYQATTRGSAVSCSVGLVLVGPRLCLRGLWVEMHSDISQVRYCR